MSNFASLAVEDRPPLETRQRPGAAHEQVKCPVCAQWRPGFCVTQIEGDLAAELQSDWACDADISRVARDQDQGSE